MRRLLLMAAVAMLALVLAACGDDDEPAVQPPATDHNTADVAFAHGMIPHHEQAIAMSDLALQRGSNAKVKDLANRIKQAQGPEIDKMKGWLSGWGEPPTASGGEHGGGHQSGMLSGSELRQLGAASGAQFDKLFLEGMIRHHEGAIKMAQDGLNQGMFLDAKALARQIIDAQQAEINEMKGLLRA